jgi:tetratricopeptide (TPR) repeat protein
VRGLQVKRAARLLAVLSVLGGAVCAQTLQQANSLHRAGRYAEANSIYQALEAKEPNNPEVKAAYGQFLYEMGRSGEAGPAFTEALQLKKDHPRALLGMALLAEEHFEARAGDLARKALEADPKLLEAQELLARVGLEDNDNARATEEAKKAIAMDPDSVGGKAVLATIDLLADKKTTEWDPKAARGYEIIGHFFVLNRRYEEGITYLQKAVEMDPHLYSARALLGINLMRLGRNDDAFQQLEACYNAGFKSDATVNTLRLMDSYKKFVTYVTDSTVLKLDKKEADLLRPYIESEMQKAITTYEKKYKIKLERPVQVEVYPDHEDFAVRTLGMPGLGALGVTFGYAIAMDSPSGRPPGTFHWGSTLWHEMSHVFTLTATGHRVPRWFTEGMAVHEETAVEPDWGDRLSPDVIMAIKEKKLLPIAQLDRGFIHPVSQVQVLVSYFQAGRIVDYINNKWGWDTLLGMLHDFGAGTDTATVVRKNLKIEPEAFDKEFLAFVEADTKTVVEHFDEWRKRMRDVVRAAESKDWGEVIKEGTAIRDFYPDFVEAHSVYETLATAYIAKGDVPAAVAQLEKYAQIGGRNPESLKLLAKHLEEAGRKKEAAAVLDKLNVIYPMDADAHRRLGTLWLEQGNVKGSIREFAAVVAKNPVDPAQAHFDLARAYLADNQKDKANEECLTALEAAPGFRPAQKLLLELSNSEPKK